MQAAPNVFLLTIDALRADRCSGQGYDRATTPELDALAEDSIEFRECVSVSSHTREAMPPLLSGYRPARFAATGFRASDDPMLAERLKDTGYATGGFHSNPYLSRAYGFDRGFDEFNDDLLLGQNRLFALAQRALEKFVFKRGEYYARADEINRRSLSWLDSLDEGPAFLWNHYMDAHGPYHAPDRRWAETSLSASKAESIYRRSWKNPDDISASEQQLLLDSYDDEIRWVDEQLGLFLDELRDRNLFEESLVIVTADHGDAFGEHGYYTHPRYLHDTLLRVPLVVSPPGEANVSVEAQVSTLDVIPTVLSFADVAGELPGTPLVMPDGSVSGGHETVFASATGEGDNEGIRRFTGRCSGAKVVIEVDVSNGATVESRAFDLESDSAEQNPLVADRYPDLLAETERYADGRLDVRDVDEGAEVTGDIEERLEALGYR